MYLTEVVIPVPLGGKWLETNVAGHPAGRTIQLLLRHLYMYTA